MKMQIILRLPWKKLLRVWKKISSSIEGITGNTNDIVSSINDVGNQVNEGVVIASDIKALAVGVKEETEKKKNRHF